MQAKHSSAEIDRVAPGEPTRPDKLGRVDRAIADAEQRALAQERAIAEATLAGRNTSRHGFELQKLELLLAILREGRDRLRGSSD